MKFFMILALAVLTFSPVQAQEENRIITSPASEEHLLDDKIYFFAHSMCIPCRDAFIFLEQYHADLNLPITDMKFHHNFELYKECVKKFNISNDELTLPLICMGNNYIMGWKQGSGHLFDDYLARMPQPINR